MDTVEANTVVNFLKTNGEGDAWKTTLFGFHRRSPVHGDEIVEVEVHERVSGPGVRFMVEARTESNRRAGGNGGDTIETALALVHWGDLDK